MAQSPSNKIFCLCCESWVSEATERRHRRGKAPMLAKVNAIRTSPYLKTRLKESVNRAVSSATASAQEIGRRLGRNRLTRSQAHALDPPTETIVTTSAAPTPRPDLTAESGSTETEEQVAEASTSQPGAHLELPDFSTQSDHAAAATAAASSLQGQFWAGRSRAATVEDAVDEDEDAEPAGADDALDELIRETSAWGFQDLNSDDAEYVAISALDRLRENFLRQRYAEGQQLSLTDEDLQYLRPFSLKVNTHMPERAFSKLPFAFPESAVPSWKACQERAAQLSGFEPQTYDCCSNSCCCFVGVHADATNCAYCGLSRLDSDGKPRRQFVYLPIIPRLKAFLANHETAQKMRYRASEHVHNPDTIKDVFDADIYRSLLGRQVSIDGKTMSHTFFENPTDVALGLSTDGFAPFRRRKQTCWPLILFNYNLPPEIRFHLANILALGVIPGPKKPVDFDSFLWPCVQELLHLELGVHAYDALSGKFCALRAFLILVFGDIPAISMVLRMKGHNGFSPCRLCEIHGIRIPQSKHPTLYVPLDRSRHPDVQSLISPSTITSYDPANLPLRTQARFLAQAREVQFAQTEAESDRLAKNYGIKGLPVLAALSSLTFPQSFPYDFMHLIWENVMKNLMLLWTNEYKALDTGRENYALPTAVWEAVGQASERSGTTIPSCFGPRTPNVAKDKTLWTADSRSFWSLFVGPVVLKGRFMNDKIYDHYIQLIKLINLCLQFEISQSEIASLREGFIHWVKKYEEYYYQYDPGRLSACPVTIHALLHIADSIQSAGPVWASWAFPMERYCGSLQAAIRSRRHPYASLNRFVLDDARLKHIHSIYPKAREQLRFGPNDLRGYFRAVCINGTPQGSYETFSLLSPRRTCKLERGVTDKIIAALCTRYVTTRHVITRALPKSYEEWARLRIEPDGDIIHAAAYHKEDMSVSMLKDSRDATYVRYEQLVDRNTHFRNRPVILEKKTFYGQLLRIIVVDMPTIAESAAKACTIVLAIIRTCVIDTSHSDLDIHYYTKEGALEVVDITTIQCLVGRIEDRKRWAIIDRSGSLARAIYVEDE